MEVKTSGTSMGGSYSIGQVADRTGLSVCALRYFERENLLVHDIRRDSAGRRIYSDDDVEWIVLCTRLRDTGMPIARLRDFATLVLAGPGNEPARLALLRSHEADVARQAEHLRECLEVISAKVSTYQAHVDAGTADGVWSR